MLPFCLFWAPVRRQCEVVCVVTMETPLLPLDGEFAPPGPAPSTAEHGSLYRTYRSLTFGEVVGQQAVTQTLRNAVRYGKVTHAYLFTGPRGTGKTSTARILARAVNCLQPRDGEPCNVCAVCAGMLERRSLDLVEIDGASNNSVDDVRELIARVSFRPAEARRKVFIIDEVHMLSIGAFNALLKTLEEPPDHVLFLLATTEVQKVPATITSRCQVFPLKPIALPEMVSRLRHICEREHIQADDDVLAFVAKQGTGSLRDALSLLEQIRAYCGEVLHLPDVEAALGLARASQVAVLAEAMAQGDLAASLVALSEMMEHGLDPRQVGRQLQSYWSEALYGRARKRPVPERHVAALHAESMALVLRSLLSVESTARRSDSPRWALELAVAEATLALGQRTAAPGAAAPAMCPTPGADGAAPTPAAASSPVPAIQAPLHEMAPVDIAVPTPSRAGEPPVRAPAIPPAEAPPDPAADPGGSLQPAADSEIPAPVVAAEARTMGLEEARERWPDVLRWLGEQNKTNIKGYLGQTTAQGLRVEGAMLVIGFPASSGFVRTQLERPANHAVLEQAVCAIYGSQWRVRCATIEGLTPPPSAETLEEEVRFFEQGLRRARRAD